MPRQQRDRLPCAGTRGREVATHRGIRVGEVHGTFALRSYAGVEGDSYDEEFATRERTDPLSSLAVQLLDLAELRFVRGVGTPMWSVTAWRRGERDVADPERDGRLRDAERVRDLGERLASGA